MQDHFPFFIIDISDSNKRMGDVLEEFEKDGKLSNYNTDGVSI